MPGIVYPVPSIVPLFREYEIEAGKDTPVQEICEQMGRSPEWLPGICLRADGYECDFYQKD